MERFLNMDRRWIFLMVALLILLVLLRPLGIPIRPGPDVLKFYNMLESVPPGSTILLSFSYGPSAAPELHPMAKATIEHAFRRDLKIITMAIWPDGAPFAERFVQEIGDRMGKKYGEDYVILGFKSMPAATLLQMGQDISQAFPTDARQRPLSELPLMQKVRNFQDIALVVDFAAGETPEIWMVYAGSVYGQEIAAGVTAVMAANFYPFLQSGQMRAMLAGLKDAAEYFGMVTGSVGDLQGQMDAQSLVHGLIVLLVILGNIFYFLQQRRSRHAES